MELVFQGVVPALHLTNLFQVGSIQIKEPSNTAKLQSSNPQPEETIMVNFSYLYRTWVAPIMFVACLALAYWSPAKAATATVPECQHDVAPVDTGRYYKDVLTQKIKKTWDQAFGTVVKMKFKADKQILETTCRTSQVRKYALDQDGIVYDTKCGNIVVSGYTIPVDPPVAAASAPAPAASSTCATDDCGNSERTVVERIIAKREVKVICPDGKVVDYREQCDPVTLQPQSVRQLPPVIQCAKCGGKVVVPTTARCETFQPGIRACEGPPPQNCACFIKANGRVPGFYFPDSDSRSCEVHQKAFAKRHNIDLTYNR